jgi:hypothetical protein
MAMVGSTYQNKLLKAGDRKQRREDQQGPTILLEVIPSMT